MIDSGNPKLNFGQGRLRKMHFAGLPLGAVKPRGWLSDQLSLQRHGFFDDMELCPDYSDESGWRGGNGESWENGPYYLRGLVSIAYVTGEQELIERAQVWIEKILSSQQENGMFGPLSNDDWWPRMPVLMALRDYYEANEYLGRSDCRILPFFEKYFRYQLATLTSKPLFSWAKARGGDNIDSVFWYYDRVYNEKEPEKTDWLLELADLIHSQTDDWTAIMNETTVRQHVVNTSQAMKTPPLWYRRTNSDSDRDALETGLFNISADHGRIDGLPNSDEAARDNLSYRGSELCGIVEGMLSTETAVRILGEEWLCDRLERLAYNALPAAYAPDYRGHVYYILQNQVLATTGCHEFDCDHGDSSAFGAPCGFDCCFANNHMGWAKFIGAMWMADADGDLAVAAYGPSVVEYRLPDGDVVSFEERTDYPFDDRIIFLYHGKSAELSLRLPIPSWCKKASISVCGETADVGFSGGFYTLKRRFNDNDVVSLTLPMTIEFSDWYNNSVAVTRGPLIYSLKIGEDWRRYTDNGTRELKVGDFGKAIRREVYPTSRWNYGLIADKSLMTVEQRPVTEQPFAVSSAPVIIHAVGQMIPEWKLDGNHAANQPYGGVVREKGAETEIELIPYGAARLKITHFPRVCDGSMNLIHNDFTEQLRGGSLYRVFSNLTLPPANDWNLKISSQSDDYRVFLNRSEISREGDTVYSLRGLSDRCRFGIYNEISFIGGDVRSVEVIPIDADHDIAALSVAPSESAFTVKVNTDRTVTAYEIDYGTDERSLTNHIRGFRGNVALVAGLAPDTDYYFRLSAVIDGVRKRSAVYNVKTTAQSDDAVVGTADFCAKTLEKDDFRIIGDADVVGFERGILAMHPSDNAKVLLSGAGKTRDYAVEATVCFRNLTGNAGIVFRVSDAGDGADNYSGYYFGLGKGVALLGSADKGWHEICHVPFETVADRAYKLSVHVYKNRIACFADSALLFAVCDDRHAAGTVGFRTYREHFAASSLAVRGLDENEIKELEAIEEPTQLPFEVSADTAFETVQISYPKQNGAEYYRIDYGTVPGFYPNTVTDIHFNGYKGSSCFRYDKFAFTFTGTTCYLKFSAWNKDRMIACTDELVVEKNKTENEGDEL